MNKRFKVGDLVLPMSLSLKDLGGDAPGTIIEKVKAKFPTKWHRVEYTVLWSSTGVITDDVRSEELKCYTGEV